MLKYCVEKWHKNKELLEHAIRSNLQNWEYWSYADLVQLIVTCILNDGEDSIGFSSHKYDPDHITEIDDGEYQGTWLFMIPRNTYQPDPGDYLFTYVNYGSCSGCDTLQGIHDDAYFAKNKGEDEREKIVKDYLNLCLHLLQNMVKPYNTGWMYDANYDIVEEDIPEC